MQHLETLTAALHEVKKPDGTSASSRSVLIPSNPTANFRKEAENRLDWLQCELALLSPTSEHYESEKRAILATARELRELIEHCGAVEPGERDVNRSCR